jgi:serine/threonine protein kinase/actin-like ATPase involved in cell morphogenesis
VDFNKDKQMVEDFFNGQYEVKKFLGEGSFAKVYLVKHNFLDDFRAMKIIKQPLSSTSNNKGIFQEVILATKLKHENIISIFDAGIISGNDEINKAFFVMEYIPGGDLEQYLNSFIYSNISMPIYRVLDIMKQILEGLNVLHSSNPPIIHRDLKLNNILLSYNACGEILIKISDFGFAKSITTNISDVDVVGTRPYMAPECFKKVASTKTDIYAIGVIFYQLLTNNFPYDIDEFSLNEMLEFKPWLSPLKAPSEFNDNVPPRLDEIVIKCLDVTPQNRYADASDLLDDINLLISEYSSGEINTIKNDYDDEFSEYIINDSLRQAFDLAKCENRLNQAIEILESEVLRDYDIRRHYGETLMMWKSRRPDVKLVSKAFTINLRGENYKLSINLLKEAIAYNPSIKNKYSYFIDLWKIFMNLSRNSNLIKAVISLENLMESNENVQKMYSNVIATLKTFSIDEIVNEAIRLSEINNLADASKLMEFAVGYDSNLKSIYSYKLSLWKQNINLHINTSNNSLDNAVDYAIDLGTSDSILSYYNDGEPIIIKNYKTGDNLTPSAVLIDEHNTVHVGHIAKNAIINNSRNAVSEFKNNMGFSIPFKFENSSRILMPEDLSAEVLKELRVSLFKQYNVNIEDVVICCPANSNPLKTKAINDAAELAGFKFHPLLLEPIAVALAYDLKAHHEDKGHWMIYDLGGGTFNVSIIKDNGREIEKVATESLDNFGGNVFDWKIVDDLLAPRIIRDLSIDDFYRTNLKYSNIFSKLKNASEIAKKELSISTQADIFIANLFDNYDFTYCFTRDDFKQIIKPYIKTSLDLCRNLLNENAFSDEDIDKIILVGGSCLSPIVQDLIREEFNIDLEYSIDPLTVVAKGAAIYAGNLKRIPHKKAPEEFSLILANEKNFISGRLFSLDDKFSFLGYVVEFINPKTGKIIAKAETNIDGEFNILLSETDYLINIYNGKNQLRINEKSPNQIISRKMHIPFFNDDFTYDFKHASYKRLSKRYFDLIKEIGHLNDFNDEGILKYLEKLFEIAQKDMIAFNQIELYLDYIEKILKETIENIEFNYLLENVENKMAIALERNLFVVSDLDDEIIKNKDIEALRNVRNQLIEKYVILNRNEVIKECFFNLIYDGVYADSIGPLSQKAIEAIDNNDYVLLLEIVNKLYKLDLRNK